MASIVQSVTAYGITGNQMAKAIRQTRGPVFIPMLGKHDVHHVEAVKADLILWASNYGDKPCCMELRTEADGTNYLDVEN